MTKSFLIAGCALVMCCFISSQGRAAVELGTKEEQDLLPYMDQETIQTCIELSTKAAQWRDKIKTLQDEAKKVQEDTDEGAGASNTAEDVIKLVKDISQELKKLSPKLREHIKFADTLEAKLQEADKTWQEATYDADEYFDLDEEDFRKEIKEIVQAAAAQEILKNIDKDLFGELEKLKNPAQFADGFTRGEMTDWLTKPREVNGMKFTLKQPDPNKSIFHPQGNVTLVLEYGAFNNARVEASGLYFEYDPGKVLPKPNFSKIKPQVDWKSLIPKELTSFGEGLPANLGLGITIKNVDLLSLAIPDDKGRYGGIKFELIVKPFEGLPSIGGKGIVYPGQGTVEWDGELTAEEPSTVFPLGTTGTALYGIKAAFDPRAGKNQLTLITPLSSLPGDPDAFNLFITMTIPFPVKQITIAGTIKTVADSVTLGTVDGTFDFTKGEVRANFHIPGKDGNLPVGNIFDESGEFTLSKKGFEGKGEATLFGQKITEMTLFIGTNGQGNLKIEERFDINDIRIDGHVDSGFTPGFKHVWAKGVCEIHGLDIGFFNLLDVVLLINADTKNQPLPVHVEASTWNIKVSFDLPTFTWLDLAHLAGALKNTVPDIYQQTLKTLAQGEENVRNTLAKAEKDFKAELNRSLGGKIDTGNENLNQALGSISEEGKKAGGELAKEREDLGKIATKLRENPKEGIKSLVDKAMSTPGAWGLPEIKVGGEAGKIIGGLIGGGQKNSGPSAEEVEAQKRAAKKQIEEQLRKAKVQDSLNGICEAINQVVVKKESLPRSHFQGDRQFQEASKLSFRFRNAVSDLDGTENARLALLVPVSGYKSRVLTGKPTTQEADSDAQPITVDIKDFLSEKPGKRPVATIHVPDVHHGSTFNASLLIRDEIQRLIELYLPQVDIDGVKHLYEKKISITNATDEPITVWVQGQTRSVVDHQFEWKWFPGEPGTTKAIRIIIPSKQTRLLTEMDEPTTISGSETAPQDRPLHASRVRLWAEGESGENWLEFRTKDLWLVNENPEFENERVYYADQMATYTYTIKPKGPRPFTERILEVRNETDDPLKVNLRYRSSQGGVARWYAQPPLTLKPGEKVEPRTAEGMRVRASVILFSAESKDSLFERHQEDPLWLVKETSGRREYIAPKIGSYVLDFKESGEKPAKPPATRK